MWANVSQRKVLPCTMETAAIKRQCSSVKSMELFALDHRAGQLCHLMELYRHFSVKLIRLALMTDSQTTMTQQTMTHVRPIIDKMNQRLLDNIKKCVDQEGVVVKFKRTCHSLADPLIKKIRDHAHMDNVMSSRPITF